MLTTWFHFLFIGFHCCQLAEGRLGQLVVSLRVRAIYESEGKRKEREGEEGKERLSKLRRRKGQTGASTHRLVCTCICK